MTDTALNFRTTLGYVTDGVGQFCTVSGNSYPVTFGLVVGWESGAIQDRDRDNTLDPRLAGICFQNNDGTQSTFRIDLTETGNHNITLALGDAGAAQAYQYCVLKDNTTTIATIDKSAGSSTLQFYDATGVLRTSAANWVSGNAPLLWNFTSTILRLVVGTPAAQTGSTTVAHLAVAVAAASGQPARRRLGLCAGMNNGEIGRDSGLVFRKSAAGLLIPAWST